jgi:hypothetical protein
LQPAIYFGTTGTARGQPLKRTWKDRKNKKDKKQLFFHVLQFWDADYNDGWMDEEINRDWGILYKLKLELERDIPEFKFRIVMRSTYYTWKEVKDAFER